MIKLVVSDIDGTLLPEGTIELNPEFFEAVRELKKKEILFVAASGRPYASMRKVFAPVADDIIFIAENGSIVMHLEKMMSSNFIDPALAREVVEYLRTLPECEIMLSVPERVYLETADQRMYELLIHGYHMEVAQTDDLMPLCERTNKLSGYREAGIAPLADQILDRFSDRLNTMVAGERWIDLMNRTADKGNALTELQKLMHISREETMAFGDNFNDIGMLQQAEESYAVANAADGVKRAAKHVAPANTENGVLRVLKEKLL